MEQSKSEEAQLPLFPQSAATYHNCDELGAPVEYANTAGGCTSVATCSVCGQMSMELKCQEQ